MVIKNIISELRDLKNPIIKMLKKGENFQVAAIGFKKDMLLEEHKSDISAKLIVLQGKVIYKEGDQFAMMSQYDELDIPMGVTYSVRALDDSLCLLVKGE